MSASAPLGSLDGPSRTIVVEPIETPVPAPKRVEPPPPPRRAPREPAKTRAA